MNLKNQVLPERSDAAIQSGMKSGSHSKNLLFSDLKKCKKRDRRKIMEEVERYRHPLYPVMFSPIKVGSMMLRNRVIVGPLSNYEEKAEAGYAMQVRGTSGSLNSRKCRITRGHYCFEDEEQTEKVAKDLLIIRRNGQKAAFELAHYGMYAAVDSGDYAIGPVSCRREDGVEVRALDEGGMKEVVEQYAEAAVSAKKLGFDSLFIHMAHGWLGGQFLSTKINSRTDEYGGSIENRARFPLMILKGVREAVGKAYPIDMSVSWEDVPDGGITLEDTISFLRMAQKYVDMVTVKRGLYQYGPSGYIAYTYMPHCINIEASKKIRENLDIPVSVSGAIMTPEEAEYILENGYADMVTLGRATNADHYWIKKAFECRSEDIVPCMRCESCYFKCRVSMRNCGDDLHLTDYLPTAEVKKKIVIVGGGPAGMKAAITAGEKGHEVVLFEKGKVLGGQTTCADLDEHKIDLRAYKNYLITQVRKRKVDVRLETEATPALVAAEHPDALILAMGASPIMPNIKGAEDPHVCQAVDSFEKMDQMGQKIAVIGGGQTACEVAYDLALKGRQVTIVEAMDELCKNVKVVDMGGTPKPQIVMLIREMKNITILTSALCKEINQKDILIETAEGDKKIEADNVILSVGFRSNNQSAEEFYGIAPVTSVIGDMNRPGTIRNTVEDGYFSVAYL